MPRVAPAPPSPAGRASDSSFTPGVRAPPSETYLPSWGLASEVAQGCPSSAPPPLPGTSPRKETGLGSARSRPPFQKSLERRLQPFSWSQPRPEAQCHPRAHSPATPAPPPLPDRGAQKADECSAVWRRPSLRVRDIAPSGVPQEDLRPPALIRRPPPHPTGSHCSSQRPPGYYSVSMNL